MSSDSSFIHTAILPNMNVSLYEALVTDLPTSGDVMDGIRADAEHVNNIVEGISILTQSEEIYDSTFPGIHMVYPVSRSWIFTTEGLTGFIGYSVWSSTSLHTSCCVAVTRGTNSHPAVVFTDPIVPVAFWINSSELFANGRPGMILRYYKAISWSRIHCQITFSKASNYRCVLDSGSLYFCSWGLL